MGTDIMGALEGTAKRRDALFGYYGEPGTPLFKIMARSGDWKYIYFANGAREQLFDLKSDPNEMTNLAGRDHSMRKNCRPARSAPAAIPRADRLSRATRTFGPSRSRLARCSAFTSSIVPGASRSSPQTRATC